MELTELTYHLRLLSQRRRYSTAYSLPLASFRAITQEAAANRSGSTIAASVSVPWAAEGHPLTPRDSRDVFERTSWNSTVTLTQSAGDVQGFAAYKQAPLQPPEAAYASTPSSRLGRQSSSDHTAAACKLKTQHGVTPEPTQPLQSPSSHHGVPTATGVTGSFDTRSRTSRSKSPHRRRRRRRTLDPRQ